MQPYQQPYSNPANPFAGADASPYAVDMPAVMRTVYLWLAIGLAVGFGVAYALGVQLQAAVDTGYASPLIQALYNPIAIIVALVAYLGVAFAFYPIVRRASVALGAVLYLVFAAVFGFLISTIFVEYSIVSIEAAFAVTAGMFAVMSLIGYTTRADLSKLGGILIMALIGIIIASLVNFFLLRSETLYWIVTYAIVIVFSGLTAYDTQWIRRQGAALVKVNDGSALARLALVGAFKLFLDFINLFLAILRIMGRARS